MYSNDTPSPSTFGSAWRRLEGLPVRPVSVRFLLAELPEDCDDPHFECAATTRWRGVLDFDPSWVLAHSRRGQSPDPLRFIADTPWWGAGTREATDELVRLWRHSVAVALAARRLAREANDPDADRVARAGLLHGLGRWAVAALDPEGMARWFAVEDAHERRAFELREWGVELNCLGHTLAQRWGCDPLVADANWLHDVGSESELPSVNDPLRLDWIREAYRLAEATPWSLHAAEARPVVCHDPRVKLLTAEVQARCTSAFVEVGDTTREESLSRSNARLRIRLESLSAEHAARGRFLEFLDASAPTEDEESLAQRASLAWCGVPGVTAARVDWHESTITSTSVSVGDSSPSSPNLDRPAAREVVLSRRGSPLARVHLWGDPAILAQWAPDPVLAGAWSSWAAGVVDRRQLLDQLQGSMQAFRHGALTGQHRLRAVKLDALAEFAAGAGHELNNPLAVIVGRAQLLLGKADDPDMTRSLRDFRPRRNARIAFCAI